jgi:vitamin B12 transporter
MSHYSRNLAVGRLLVAAGMFHACDAAVAPGSHAQTTVPETVVTATRTTTPIEQVGSSVTVITAADMERRQQRTVLDALRAVPGLQVVQLGGAGQQTSVFARGTNSNHALVLIDGLEANDPSSPNGAFDFAHLFSENIEKIEVVRGPQSTLYGSDAIGTVVNIITKKGSGAPRATARLEAGTRATVEPAAGVTGSAGPVNYSASASYFATGGQSVSPERLRPPGAINENDAYDNLSASARLGVDLGKASEVAFIGRYVRADTDIDPTPEDPNATNANESFYGRLQGKTRLFDGLWEPTLALNFTRYDRDSENDPDTLSATFQRTNDVGRKYKAELQNDFNIDQHHLVTFGLEAERDKLEETTFTDFGGFIVNGTTDASVDNKALYLQDKITYGPVSGTIGVRRDHHQTFGNETTYRVAPAWRVGETGTRLKGAYGTGFRAPSLFELFGFTANNFGGIFRGNPNLSPEESRGWEAGFDQALLDSRLRFGSVYFNNDIKNLIICNLNTCNNVSKADTWGAETFIAFDVIQQVTLRLDYTYTRAEDAAVGSDLVRRPKHKFDAEIQYRPTDRSQVTLAAAAIGPQKDVDSQTGGTVYKGGYTLFNIAGSYRLTDSLELFSRVVNMFDREYEPADGFRGPGLEAFFGARKTF